mmetsp:Transcript_37803/g.57870  ORF Transcript_37803/g.57870 Transcript_37803/m.57870 type:complete len:209 (-) Transcript_37803:500-1126(-)
MFEEIVIKTAHLAAFWQAYGFCHGVLNTDNMSINGLTIDYGPFAWMEHFDPDFICNHSDRDRGRYRYKAQPEICKWNLEKLAEAWSTVVDQAAMTRIIDSNYDSYYSRAYYGRMRQKLGFSIVDALPADLQDQGTHRIIAVEPEDELPEAQRTCIDLYMEAMEQTGADFTDAFRILTRVPIAGSWEEALEALVKVGAPLDLREKQQEP